MAALTYTMVSINAVLVIACITPIHLIMKERKIYYAVRARNVVEQLREETYDVWQSEYNREVNG